MSETWIGTTGREAGVTAVSAFLERWKRRAAAPAPSTTRSALARVSLFVVIMTSAVGCVDTPPEYTEPTRIPPQIIMNLVDPPLTSLFVTPISPITFTIPFRADDAGQNLVARFIVDIEIGSPDLAEEVPIPEDGRPFAQQIDRKPLSYPWSWQATEPTGCHTMTAIITEQSNFAGRFNLKPDKEFEAARVTWFLWLRNTDLTDSESVDCLQNKTKSTSP